MAKLEAFEGLGVLILAVAMLAAFTLRMSVPPADVLRAASAPRIVTVHPTVVVDTR
jgi:hypothetical protein